MRRAGTIVALGWIFGCGSAVPCPQGPPPSPGVAASATAVAAPTASAPPSARRVLTVALYPYVPDFYRMFADAKADFEKRHGDVEVVPVWLPNYYDSSAPDSVRKTTANVLEIDSVFLADMVKDNRLVPLPDGSTPSEGDYARPAVAAARQNGRWIGSPHWLCSDFVYSTKAKPFTGKTLKELEHFVGAPHPDGGGLLIDAMGKSTLGELYLDALVDESGAFAAALTRLPRAPEAGPVNDLQRLLGLCDSKMCRRQDYHDDPSGYPHEFAQRHGSALVGYSEATNDIMRELRSADCAKAGSCIDPTEVVVTTFPAADAGARPFVWVDTLGINETCTDACVADAAAFISMMNEDTHLRADLFPTLDAPRYLLPAKVTLDAELASRAPLYASFRSITADAPPAMDLGLGDRLHDIGSQVNKQLKH